MSESSLLAFPQPAVSKAPPLVKGGGMKWYARTSNWALALILLVAFLVRVYYLRAHVVVLEGEGAGYAHQADNLLRGRGFESYLYPKPDLEHCWLQPILIAGAYLAVRNLDTATHAVSLVSGTLLVLWFFLLADRHYGRSAAWIAALFAAFHPLLVALSTTGYAEILAAALQFGAIYWSLRFIEDDGRLSWLYAGALWGFSYLNRTECLPIPIFTIGLFFVYSVWKTGSLKRWVTRSALFMSVFSLLVIPYVMLFHHYTGKFLFEGKNLLNYTIGQRELEGKSLPVASRELTADLRELGPDLDTSAYTTFSPYPTGMRDLARYYVRAGHKNAKWLRYELLDSDHFGGGFLVALTFFGLVGRQWDQRRLFCEGYLIGIVMYIVLLVLATHLQIWRYAFPLLPFILLWAALGAVYLFDWFCRTSGEIHIPATAGTIVSACAVLLYVLFVFRLVNYAVPTLDEITSGWAPNQELKEAGLWLRHHDPGFKTAFTNDVFCYYSRSYESIFPYTDGETALRYLHEKNPDYIFLYSDSVNAPYYSRWVEEGIPDPSAIPIYERVLADHRKIAIYRWDHTISSN
jgi:hypothetical protein